MRQGKPNAHVIAQLGIAIAVERLLRDGFLVAIPIVDDGYDLLAFCGRRYWRVQVKATRAVGGREGRRVRIAHGRLRKSRYCPRRVDAFIAVHIERRVVMCIPVAKTAGRRWLNWSELEQWSDCNVLRSIRPVK